MAIKFLASKRVIGTNAERADTAISPSTDEDIQDETWTLSHADITQGSSYIQWANMTGGTEAGVYDIGTANITDTWKLQFKATVSSYTSGTQTQSRYCGLSLSSESSTWTGTQNSICVVFRTQATTDSFNICTSTDEAVNGVLAGTAVSGATLGNGTFYITLERTSPTNATITVRTGSHTGTELGSASATITSSLDELRWIKTDRLYQSAADGNFVIKFEEIDLTTYSTVTPNIQANSVWEASDTGVHWILSSGTWVQVA